jgi:hypothetical protein
MSKWDDQKYKELIGGSKVNWSIVLGCPYQGKSTLATTVGKHLGFKLIDWNSIEKEVKDSLGTADEPFEGKYPSTRLKTLSLSLSKMTLKTVPAFNTSSIHSLIRLHKHSLHSLNRN